MDDLATLTHNEVRFDGLDSVVITARPTPLQQEAFDRLGVRDRDRDRDL
ncbi:MAG: hypothetical protein ACFB6R_13640 [Alphaproteobacteria bacterium]